MSEINPITIMDLAQEVRALAQNSPEHKASCTYVRYENDTQVPNCVVGKAMAKLGIPLSELKMYNATSIDALTFEEEVEWLDIRAEQANRHVTWLRILQQHQDSGYSWGDALAWADRMMVKSLLDI